MKKVLFTICCMLFAIGTLFAQNKITEYEYWFDNDYSGKVQTTVTANTDFHLQTNIPCQHLAVGLHTFNIRFKDQDGSISSTVSQYFQKLPNQEDKKIVAYEYWIDNNYAQRVTENVNPTNEYTLSTQLDFEALSTGLHVFNMRFKDNEGMWSAVACQYFQKIEKETASHIVAYEYWIDEHYDNRKTVEVTPSETLQLAQSIPLEELAAGLHSFSIRFKDQTGKWSAIANQYFQKLETDIPKNLVAYEYWINGEYEKKITKTIANTKSIVLLENIDCSAGTKATNVISYRFQDDAGQWSSTVSANFYRPVEPAFTHITNLSSVAFTNHSKYADTYLWDFGDSTTSNQVHPEHVYKEPGVYQVKLIAKNKEFTDSILHWVEIEGVKKITNHKGGNSGLASFDIHGGGLDTNTLVKLVKGSETIATYTVYKKEPGIICATFDLTNKEVGIYDIIVIANGNNYSLEKAFEIEEVREPKPWLKFEGNTIFIPGRWQTYTIHYGNSGNIDIYGLPLNLFIENTVEYEFLFDLIDSINDESVNNILDSSNFLSINSLYTQTFKGKMFSFLIPHLGAGSEGSFSFKLKAQVETKIIASTNGTLNDVYLNKKTIITKQTNEIFGYDLNATYNIDTSKLYNIIREEIRKSFNQNYFDSKKQFVNFTKLLAVSNSFTIKTKSIAAGIPGSILNLDINGTSRCAACMKDGGEARDMEYLMQVCCYICPLCDVGGYSGENITPQISFDPNEILGPSGYSEHNYTKKKSHFDYTLFFENHKDSATAPAQEIILIDTLDRAKFNVQDFNFGTITFRDITIEAIPGMYEFSKDIDMREKGENIIIRISATFDTITGIAKWYFIALDPTTMDLTENPNLGILYPNTEPPIGEGNVTYRIGLLPEIGHGTLIKNQGHITFDLNKPIATNIWQNTIDDKKPVSSMSALPKIVNDTAFMVSWSGNDELSGIQHYSVYVCENDGEYRVWQYHTIETSAKFIGQPGITYRFYCIATDNVGNTEDIKPFETFTSIQVTLSSLTVDRGILNPSFLPNILNYSVNIEHEIDSLTIHATASDTASSIKGIGKKTLQVGDNKFTITVISSDSITKQDYNVTVIRANTSDTNSTDIIELTSDIGIIKIYPNPTSGKLTIEIEPKTNSPVTAKILQFFDFSGKLVAIFTLTGKVTKVDISHLPKGVYFVKVGGETVKVIKK